jgi:uncharacterized protein (UPF0261 family)
MAVVLIGTLDTKAEEVAFARDVLEEEGVSVHVVDVGVLGDPGFEADTPAREVAAAAGADREAVAADADRGEAIGTMGEGAAEILSERHAAGRVEGVLGLGGSGNTSIATTAMRALPLGVPKLMLSTVASGDVERYVGTADITMAHSVADIEGLNEVTRTVITNAALAMGGMADGSSPIETDERPTVALTMFGVTTPCVRAAREYLEARGYETVVFHATGTGGRTMERLIREGFIDGVLDVTTTEWADELVGGELGAGPERLTAASEAGVPQVVSVGALDVVNFGPPESVPERFEGRTFHRHNPQVTLMRTTPAECAELGRVVAAQLGAPSAPTAVALPSDGPSALAAEGEPFHDPEADAALNDSLRDELDDGIELLEVETHINDAGFGERLAALLDSYMREAARTREP